MREFRENLKLKIRTLVDNFAKPVMCLLLDVIQWFMENGIDYEPESIYSDVRVRNCILPTFPAYVFLNPNYFFQCSF